MAFHVRYTPTPKTLINGFYMPTSPPRMTPTFFAVKQRYYANGEITVSVENQEDFSDKHLKFEDHELIIDVFEDERMAKQFAECLRFYSGLIPSMGSIFS
jgi:hypothetical protein